MINNFLVNETVCCKLQEGIQKYTRGKLIDIGCGEKPYKNITQPYVTEHIGLDHKNTLYNKSKIDLFGTALKFNLC